MPPSGSRNSARHQAAVGGDLSHSLDRVNASVARTAARTDVLIAGCFPFDVLDASTLRFV